jgi:hypothetical protein
MLPTFFEMLASTLVTDADGNTFFNVVCYNGDCDDLNAAIACDTDISHLERYIVANGFTTDNCGLPAIKLRVCVDADAENAEGELV